MLFHAEHPALHYMDISNIVQAKILLKIRSLMERLKSAPENDPDDDLVIFFSYHWTGRKHASLVTDKQLAIKAS